MSNYLVILLFEWCLQNCQHDETVSSECNGHRDNRELLWRAASKFSEQGRRLLNGLPFWKWRRPQSVLDRHGDAVQFFLSLQAWAKSQQNLISRLHPTSNHIVVNGADHRMLYRRPEALIDPIKRLIKFRKSRTSVTGSKTAWYCAPVKLCSLCECTCGKCVSFCLWE